MFKKFNEVMNTPITWGSYLKVGLYSTAIGGLVGAIYGVVVFTDVGGKIKEKLAKHGYERIDEDDFE